MSLILLKFHKSLGTKLPLIYPLFKKLKRIQKYIRTFVVKGGGGSLQKNDLL